MKIKAIIYDLDDTLYDCSGTLVDAARKRAANAMIKTGLKLSEKQILEKIEDIEKRYGKRINLFDKICEEANVDKSIGAKGLEAYNADVVEDIKLFPDVLSTLNALKDIKHIIITTGKRTRQELKIQKLGIKDKFDYILINELEDGLSKENCFKLIMEKFSLKPNQIIVVGDRIQSEIKVGNQLKMNTIQLLHGRYKDLIPKNDLEEPDYKIKSISELINLTKDIEVKNIVQNQKIVVIGGGTGLPTVLEGLKKYTSNLTAVVTVTDSGRSSGMLRKDLDIPPPGDIRNCLVALSNAERELSSLFQYRFENGSLEGHSFGNLLIAALTKTTGSFEKAIKEVSKILNIKGKVLPSTLENVHICAEFEDGKIIKEEDNIIDRENQNVHLRSKIKRVFLSKEAEACKEAVDEIQKADMVVIGPGSLFTSVITNLLIKGIKEAIVNSKAKKVYICNITAQPCQTYGFKASDHIKKIINYLGQDVLDYAILNNKAPSYETLKKYEEEGASLVENDSEEIKKLGINVIEEDLLEKDTEKRVLFQKKYLLRHDSDKIASLIKSIILNTN